MAHDLFTIKEIHKSVCDHLQRRANVVATGVGYKMTGGQKTPSLSIICSVVKKWPVSELSPADKIPERLEGIPTDVIATGRIRALPSRTDRHRPAPGGVSIGHREITAGTLGCLVKRRGEIMILSNNHVMANSNDAETGDAILQPGPADGGRFPQDHIANLEAFIPIAFPGQQPPGGPPPGRPPSGCSTARGAASILNAVAAMVGSDARLAAVTLKTTENRVDAAIARPVNLDVVINSILEIGPPSGTVQGSLGLAIRKSGRTTGFTTGEITQVDVTVNVQYGPGQTARFTDQLLAGPMSQGGDSGSAVLDEQNRLVGLLFAGSENSTVINRIEHVFSALELTL